VAKVACVDENNVPQVVSENHFESYRPWITFGCSIEVEFDKAIRRGILVCGATPKGMSQRREGWALNRVEIPMSQDAFLLN
jgi:hypothetical protein